ncbi:c-type cytochrome [Anatilimnocola sp. NA78]|uniref:cytochrome c n=1 Tax=Anatilimnocola sp. NA78 TaxID=3415683 RepID=UPI003CE4FFF4
MSSVSDKVALCVGMAFMCIAGCGAPVELKFTSRDDLQQLPKKHQEQIRSSLEEYFGTARFPRFLAVAPAEEQPADAASPKLVEREDRGHLQHGQAVYLNQCAGCHGVTGDGQGPAAKYLDPPPRDYRLGKFKFTSTPRGVKPRRTDLQRILRRGAKGTSMPSFPWMADDDLEAVIDYVMLLSSRGELEYRLGQVAQGELAEEDDIVPVLVAEQAQGIAASWDEAEQQIVRPLTREISPSPETVAAGAKAFVQLNCYKCHGRDGRGIKTGNIGKDDWGRVARAADLTTGTLHGGGRPIDIYRRIYSGINGTPMPAFAQPDANKGETETQRSDTIWHLSHFVNSVASGQPLPLDVIDTEIREQLKAQPIEPTAAPSE